LKVLSMSRVPAHPAAAFASVAKPWCVLVETRRPMRLATLLKQLHRRTLALSVEAVRLPRTRRSAPEPPEAFRAQFRRILEHQHDRLREHSGYRAVSDALAAKEQAADLSLAVDLADTWEEVAFGLDLWRHGRRDEAHAVWFESYRFHWHKHVSDGLHVLHQHVEGRFPTGA
jgi:hypothetical protein